MRVTSRLIANTVTANLNRETEQLLKAQNTVSSGKLLSKPSDDPIAMDKILDYRRTLSSMDQYSRNIERGKTRLEYTETVFDGIEGLLHRAKGVAMETGQDTATQSFLAEEMESIREQVLQLANSKFDNVYIFGGHKNTSPPFSQDGTYNGDDGDYRLITGENTEIKIVANGGEIFQGVEDIFSVLGDLQAGLETDDAALISAQNAKLHDAIGQIRKIRAGGAAKLKQLEMTGNNLKSFKIKIEDMLSSTENAEIAKAIVDLKTQETAYQTSIAAAARIIQPSLLNFLR
jgi:flagellar hook-associated protein 3 FlgL